jgi:hypothetical protein
MALAGGFLLVRNDREAACVRLPLAEGRKEKPPADLIPAGLD